MNTPLLIRICIVALVILGITIAWQYIKDANPGMLLIFFIVVGTGFGIFAVKHIVPWIGDAMGTFFFSSGEEVRLDDSMKAAAKLAQGDYEGAIAEYEKMAAAKPEDAFPVAEIAKIRAEKMGDPQKALRFLQQRLEGQEWGEDAAAFLMFRMVDLHLGQGDHQAAHDLLEEVIGNFPNTRHSANAHHRMREVEEAQFKAGMDKRLKSGGQPS